MKTHSRPSRSLKILAAGLTAVATLIATTALSIGPASATPPSFPIPGAQETTGLGVAPDGSYAWVCVTYGDPTGHQAMKIDTATQAVTKNLTFSDSEWPTAITVAANGTFAYMTTYGSTTEGRVYRIDTATDDFVGSPIDVGNYPTAVAISADSSVAITTNANDNTVSLIEPGTDSVKYTKAVGHIPLAVAIAPDSGFAYVVNTGGSSVSRVDTRTGAVTGPISVGWSPQDVAFSSDGAFAYVVNGGDGTISKIRTSDDTVVSTIPVAGAGTDLRPLAVNPADGRIVTADYTADKAYVVDPNTEDVSSFDLGVGSYGPKVIAFDQTGSFGYVLNRIAAISTLKAPSAPTITSATGGDKSVTVNFDPSDGNGLDVSYQYSLDGGSTWQSTDPETTSGPLTISGLEVGTTYQVKLRGVSIFSEGVASAPVSVKTTSPTPTPTPTPTPSTKKAQKLANSKGKPPARIRLSGVTVVTHANARTNANQLLRTRVIGGPTASNTQGEVRYLRVIRGANGKVSVKTFGHRDLKIVVTQTAPPTSEYKRYLKRTVYVGGVKQ